MIPSGEISSVEKRARMRKSIFAQNCAPTPLFRFVYAIWVFITVMKVAKLRFLQTPALFLFYSIFVVDLIKYLC